MIAEYKWTSYAMLITATVGSFYLLLYLSNAYFPEYGCVSFRSFFMAITHFAFFLSIAFRMGRGGRVTPWILARNLIVCTASPYVIFMLLLLPTIWM